MPYGDDPANDPEDALRLLIGDTTSPALLSDNEVAYFLAEGDDVALTGAALAAGALAARYAGLVDATEGDVSRSWSQKAKQFAELAKRLAEEVMEAAGSAAVPIPWAGGISYADNDANAADRDVVPAYFYEGMDSRPGTSDDGARRGCP